MPKAEYSNAVFGRIPNAYGVGRAGYGVRLSVVHYTAGSESRSSAENGNVYDSTRTDGTSCHVFHDPDSSVQEVLRQDRANSAFFEGNRIGVHHEYCGTAQTRAQWLDPASDAILWRAARAHAEDCMTFGLEPRHLSVTEVRKAWTDYPNGPRGICGHADITLAFPGPGRTHTDPGKEFPWDILIGRVQSIMNGDDMDPATEERLKWFMDAFEFGRTEYAGGPLEGREVKTIKDINEIHARPQVEPAPIDPASLKAALMDPEVAAYLLSIAQQGAEAAEDA